MVGEATVPPEGVGRSSSLPYCDHLSHVHTDDGSSTASSVGIGGSKRCLACQFSLIASRISSKVPHAHSCLKFRSCDWGPSTGALGVVAPLRGLSTPPATSSWGPLASPRGPEYPSTPGRVFAGIGGGTGGLEAEELVEILNASRSSECNINCNSRISSICGNTLTTTSSNSDSSAEAVRVTEVFLQALEEAGPPVTNPQEKPMERPDTIERHGAPTGQPSNSKTSGSSSQQEQQHQQQQQRQEQQQPGDTKTKAMDDLEGEDAAAETRKNGPLVLIVTGMAGSGKSTLIKAMDE